MEIHLLTFINRFSEAALAFENANSKYKAVFAEPKPKKDSNSDNSYNGVGSNNRRNSGTTQNASFSENTFNFGLPNNRRLSFDTGGSNNFNNTEATLNVICSLSVNQDQLWRIFDIVPGLDFCQINGECKYIKIAKL